MHQTIDAAPDLWLFHDAGDHRQVRTILSFCCYALSPSTELVVYFPDPLPPGWPPRVVAATGEIRAYGPDKKFVWYHLLRGSSLHVGSMVAGLLKEMQKAGKLTIL